MICQVYYRDCPEEGATFDRVSEIEVCGGCLLISFERPQEMVMPSMIVDTFVIHVADLRGWRTESTP